MRRKLTVEGIGQMLKKTLATITLLALLTVSLTVLAPKVWAATTTLRLDPSSIVDETLTPGLNFTLTVQIMDVENIFAYEFKAYFNNSVLNATKAVRPAGHLLEPLDPMNQFTPKWEIKNNFNATHGRLWLGFTLLSPETARTGSGELVEITFDILSVGFTPIEFADDKLADSTASPILHDKTNSYFSNTQAPPPPPLAKPAHISIDPPDITDPTLVPSNNFTVTVGIVNATDVGSFAFNLSFNPSIVEALALEEGSFLRNVDGTLSAVQINNTNGFVFMFSSLFFPPATSGASGDGDLATIDFHVLSTGSTSLTLSNVALHNSTDQPLDLTFAGGHFSNVALEGDVNGDGIVDILDLNMAAVSFGATPDSPQWNAAADLNSDGIINVFDLVIIVMNFGNVIPEYTEILMLPLLITAFVAAFAVRRKKRQSSH